MIRQQAFEGKEKLLKGGLHCHTTRSDGVCSPEEVVRLYYQNGFDFLAITDHRIYNYKNFAPEVPITIIPGMEFDNTFERHNGFRTFHSVCLGPAKEDGNGFEQDEKLLSGTAANQEEYQRYLDEFHAKGNLTIYCHPQWSSTPARYFDKLKGNFAMEVWNTGCALDCTMDTDAAYWDELLGQGQKIFGVATDDGHLFHHHGNGWVMVRAENNIRSILSALEEGAFYSSCGPKIFDFYVDDGKAVVECSPAAMVRFHSDMHPTRMVRSKTASLTKAEYPVKTDGGIGSYRYIRATVIDRFGRYAWTNPIFLE